MAELLLRIGRADGEWEGPCDNDCDNGRHRHDVFLRGLCVYAAGSTCQRCGGTGQRTYWLEGLVPFTTHHDRITKNAKGISLPFQGEPHGFYDERIIRAVTGCEGALEYLAKSIIAEHRAGTIPAELYARDYEIRPGVFGTGDERGLREVSE